MARDSRAAEGYEPRYTVSAEGWRIGLAVCKTCGAVVLMGGDGEDKSLERHDAWHRKQERHAE